MAAICIFLAQGWYFTGTQFSWHEETATHAAPPSARLVRQGETAEIVGVCDGSSWFVYTDQRPQLVLCAGGLAWPVLITPYLVGVHYWPLQLLRPLHQGDLVPLRRTALLIGVAALIVLFIVVERLGGPLRAAVVALTTAVLPAFVILHSLLISFELLPPLLLACAVLVIVTRPDASAPVTPARAAAASALTALALMANIKAAVTLLPLLAFALFESPVLRRTSRRSWIAAAAAGSLVLIPMIVATLADPTDRFSYEVYRRFGIAASRLNPFLFGEQILDTILFAGDLQFYFDVASGGDGSIRPWTLLAPAVAFTYGAKELARALRRLPHDQVAAMCGAVQIFFVIFAWLAYNQVPGGNYCPIVYIQAIGLGCAAVAVGRFLTRRGLPTALACGVVLVVTHGALVFNTYRRGDPRDFETISMNLNAVRALGEHLQRTPDRTVVVTTYNLAGLPDNLTGKPSVGIDRELEDCTTKPEVEACEHAVVRAAITQVPHARFLVPLRTSIVDKASARRVVATIERAAADLGARVHEEARFATGRGVPVLALLAVDDAPPTPPSAP